MITSAHRCLVRLLIFVAVPVLLSAALARADADRWLESIRQSSADDLYRLIPEQRDINRATARGRTALMVAAFKGHGPLIDALLDAGADVNKTNRNGGTALMYATVGGHEPAVRRLIKAGANVDAAGTNGWTALMIAAAKGFPAIARLLVEAGADVNARDVYGWSPLMRAVYQEREDVARCLLDQDSVKVNVQADTGTTALHLAALRGQVKLTRLLLRRGADASVADADGRLPLNVAQEVGHQQLASLLRPHAAIPRHSRP